MVFGSLSRVIFVNLEVCLFFEQTGWPTARLSERA